MTQTKAKMKTMQNNPTQPQTQPSAPNRQAIIAAVLSVIALIAAIAAVIAVITTSTSTPASTSVEATASSTSATVSFEATLPSPYQTIVASYRELLTTGNAPTTTPAPNSAILDIASYEGATPAYALVDLAQDGTPELAIALKFPSAGNGTGTSGNDATYRVYAIYTLTGDEATSLNIKSLSTFYNTENAFDIATFGDDPICDFREDGLIHVSCNRANMFHESYWQLQSNSETCEPIEIMYETMPGDYVYEGFVNNERKHVKADFVNDKMASHKPDESIEWHEILGEGSVIEDEVSSNSQSSQKQTETASKTETYVTPAYTIVIPDEWRDDYRVDLEIGAPPEGATRTGVAWQAKVYFGSDYAFDVAAFTEDWGIQGDFDYVKLGPSHGYPGWNVFVYVPRAKGDARQYADYVIVSAE